MTTDERIDAIVRRAERLWGAASQVRMIQEECAELIAVINQYDRRRVTADDVAGEIADVMLCLAYARIVFGPERIDAAVAAKLYRLETRVTQGERERVATLDEGAT